MSFDHVGGCSCCADAWVDDAILGSEDLNSYIDIERVVCLNEAHDGDVKAILSKGWCHKAEAEPALVSDADEQLIILIPFTVGVKIKSISLVTADSASSPSDMEVFLNRDDVDFDNVDDLNAVQEWTLPADTPADGMEYPTNYAKFQNVQSLVLYIPANHGADETVLR
eukprot:SAG22_NODE_8210_length_674_cov_1.353043_1_plen_167_part_01